MLNIWFMYDNHTFARVNPGDAATMKAQASRLFEENGCGSLFVRDENDGRLNALTLHGHPLPIGKYGVTDEELSQWAERVETEEAFRHRMHA